MKNILKNLLFSVILLIRADAATDLTTSEQQAEAFIKAFDIARICLKQVNAGIDQLKINSRNISEGILTSPDIHTRELNIYTRICELEKEFLEEKSQSRRIQIADHLAILSYSNSLIPSTLIDQELRNKLFNKISGERSDSAEYFIRCLVYDESTAQFTLTQDRRLNSAMSSYMSIAQAAIPLIQSRKIANGDDVIRRYKHIDSLIFAFKEKIAPYQWSLDKLSTLFEIFDQLEPDLSALAPKLYQINAEIKKIVDDHAKMQILLSNIYSRRVQEIINNLNAERPEEVEDLTEEKISRLITARIKLYKRSVKDLQENQKGSPRTDPHHTHFVCALKKRIETYELAKNILARSRILEAEQKRASMDNLYILLLVHMQSVKHEKSPEGFYIKPIIDFLESDHSEESEISEEAKIFANIISIKYENSEIKYDIEFKDDLHEKWTLQHARFRSLPNVQLLTGIESIFSAITDLENTYKKFTCLFKELTADSKPLSTLFETFKPIIAQYKKQVSKKINIFENLINRTIPSSEKKKKRKKKGVVTQSEPLIEGVNDSSAEVKYELNSESLNLTQGEEDKASTNIDTAAGDEYEAVKKPSDPELTGQQQPLSKEEIKKIQKEQRRKERAESAELENLKMEVAELTRKEEQERLGREAAELAEQARQAKCKKKTEKKELRKLVKLAAANATSPKTFIVGDIVVPVANDAAQSAGANTSILPLVTEILSDTAQLIAEEPNKIMSQDGITASVKEEEFKFNPLAAEFKPTLAAAVTDKHESTDGDELGNEEQYAGVYVVWNPSAPAPYDPNYAAWLAWQQYYALQMQQGHGYY